jgi:hypothetical protein
LPRYLKLEHDAKYTERVFMANLKPETISPDSIFFRNLDIIENQE